MFRVSLGEYELACQADGLPLIHDRYEREVEESSVVVKVEGWPEPRRFKTTSARLYVSGRLAVQITLPNHTLEEELGGRIELPPLHEQINSIRTMVRERRRRP